MQTGQCQCWWHDDISAIAASGPIESRFVVVHKSTAAHCFAAPQLPSQTPLLGEA